MVQIGVNTAESNIIFVRYKACPDCQPARQAKQSLAVTSRHLVPYLLGLTKSNQFISIYILDAKSIVV